MSKEKKQTIINTVKQAFKGHKKAFIAGAIAIVVLVGFFSWRTLAQKEEQPQLQTATVEKGMIISSVSASGQILSVNVMSANTKAAQSVLQLVLARVDLLLHLLGLLYFFSSRIFQKVQGRQFIVTTDLDLFLDNFRLLMSGQVRFWSLLIALFFFSDA